MTKLNGEELGGWLNGERLGRRGKGLLGSWGMESLLG